MNHLSVQSRERKRLLYSILYYVVFLTLIVAGFVLGFWQISTAWWTPAILGCLWAVIIPKGLNLLRIGVPHNLWRIISSILVAAVAVSLIYRADPLFFTALFLLLLFAGITQPEEQPP